MTIAYHAHSASPSSSTGAPHWYHLHFVHFEPDILSHNNLKLSSWMFPIRVSTSLLETKFPSSNPRVQTWQVCRKQSLPFFLFETSNFTKVNLNMVNPFFWMYIIFLVSLGVSLHANFVHISSYPLSFDATLHEVVMDWWWWGILLCCMAKEKTNEQTKRSCNYIPRALPSPPPPPI